jgi:pimeloyl-ACP methyl ester carboxylesterase
LGRRHPFEALTSPTQQILGANGVNLCAEAFGDPAHPTLLLISGSSGSMDWWRTEFCRRLAEGERRVVRYDHRDTGQSAHSKPGAPDYSGADLVADAVGLLDALGIDSAHVAGVSMGGGIGQVLALDHPERVASLTLMSTSPLGADLPPPTDALAARFADPVPPPDWSNRDEVIDYIVQDHRAYAGTLPFDADEVRGLAAIVVGRTIDIEASMTNHSLLSGGDPLRPRLGQITAPTLVIHGTEDPLFPLAHGEALAREIPGRLVAIEGMGHEVPPRPVWDQVIAAILEHTRGSD